MKTLLWLDDIRNPHENDWLKFSPVEHPFKTVWVKDYLEFTNYIEQSGLPDAICFDHDLSDLQAFENNYPELMSDVKCNEKTGFDCAKYLVDYCIDKNLSLPLYNIQSANPAGKENIKGLLENFKKYQDADN